MYKNKLQFEQAIANKLVNTNKGKFQSVIDLTIVLIVVKWRQIKLKKNIKIH